MAYHLATYLLLPSFKSVYPPLWRPKQMRIVDAITIGFTVRVARLLRGLLHARSLLLRPFKAKTLSPFGKCDKIALLRNNRSEIRLRNLKATFPTTTEEAPQRQIVQ
jgi:hypothetical protein